MSRAKTTGQICRVSQSTTAHKVRHYGSHYIFCTPVLYYSMLNKSMKFSTRKEEMFNWYELFFCQINFQMNLVRHFCGTPKQIQCERVECEL